MPVKDGNSLGLADAVVFHQVLQAFLAQGVEVVATILEHVFHQVYGTLLGRARPDEDGEQLGFAECFSAQLHEFFARTVFLCPLVDVEFVVHLDA